MSDVKPKGIEVGPPIYIESCMTEPEYRQLKPKRKTWTNQYASTVDPQLPGYKWRFGMGKSLSATEITNINDNIKYLLENFKPAEV